MKGELSGLAGAGVGVLNGSDETNGMLRSECGVKTFSPAGRRRACAGFNTCSLRRAEEGGEKSGFDIELGDDKGESDGATEYSNVLVILEYVDSDMGCVGDVTAAGEGEGVERMADDGSTFTNNASRSRSRS